MSKTNHDGDKLRDCVRVAKCEVESVGGDWMETTDRWRSLSIICQKAANFYYETWLVWHIQNDSASKIEAWLNARQAIKDRMVGETAEAIKVAQKEEAGQCPVQCLTPELAKQIYLKLTRGMPSYTAHCMSILTNGFKGCLNGKAARGSLPRWTASLLHNQKIPSFTSGLPIPFGKQDCKLVKRDGGYFIEAKLWRVPVPGKKAGICITDDIELRSQGKGCSGVKTMLDKIFTGEWEFKGSSLEWDSKRRKWFVNVCHQRTSNVVAIEPGKVAYLRAARKNIFSLHVPETRKRNVIWLQGRGQHILGARERIWKLRSEKNTNYRHATVRKGRGVGSAGKWRASSALSWRHLVRRVNHCVSRDAVEACVAKGCATLIYFQPEGRIADTRLISGSYKNSTWEFHQLGTMLAYKCQERGVNLIIHKVGGERLNDAEKTGTARTNTKVKAGKSSVASKSVVKAKSVVK